LAHRVDYRAASARAKTSSLGFWLRGPKHCPGVLREGRAICALIKARPDFFRRHSEVFARATWARKKRAELVAGRKEGARWGPWGDCYGDGGRACSVHKRWPSQNFKVRPTRLQTVANYRPPAITRGYRMSGGLAAIGEGEDPTRLQADANYRPSAITRGYRMSGGLARSATARIIFWGHKL